MGLSPCAGGMGASGVTLPSSGNKPFLAKGLPESVPPPTINHKELQTHITQTLGREAGDSSNDVSHAPR